VSDLGLALAAAGTVVACAAGVGSVACVGARSWSAGERWVLRLVAGIGLLPLLQIAAHELIGLRARPWVALALGGAGITLAAVQERRWRRSSAPTAADLPLALVLAIGLLFSALTGLLGQPGFEGLDPWGHAFGAAYLADIGVLRQPDPGFPLIHYVDAYPPLYDLLLALPVGLLGVVSPAVKGAAALLVAVAPLAVWLLARRLRQDERYATVACLLYALLPSAVPHHPWGHSLAVVLLLGTLIAALELRREPRFGIALAATCGGLVLAAPSQGLKGAAMLLATAVVAAAFDRRWFLRLLAAGAGGMALAAIWLLPAASRAGFEPTRLTRAMQAPELRRADDPVFALPEGQEAPRPWMTKPLDRFGAADVLFFRPHPWLLRLVGEMRVNFPVPAGLGLPLLLLGITGLLPERGRPLEPARALAMVWLAVAALLTFGAPLGIQLFPWRSWLLLAPTAALVGARGALRLAAARGRWWLAFPVVAITGAGAALAFDLHLGRVLPQLARPAWLVVILAASAWTCWSARSLSGRRQGVTVTLMLLAHLVVAGPVRAASLLEQAAPRVFYDRLEHRSYLELAVRLPRSARVWPLSGGLRFEVVTGLDLGCTPFRAEEVDLARRCTLGDPPPPEALVRQIAALGYRFVVLDPSCAEIQGHRGDPQGDERLRAALDACPGLKPVLVHVPEWGDGAPFVVWEIAASPPLAADLHGVVGGRPGADVGRGPHLVGAVGG